MIEELMSLSELLAVNGGFTRTPIAGLSEHDIAHLAEWAGRCKDSVVNPDWKRPFALIREGADLLLRRRAMSAVNTPLIVDTDALVEQAKKAVWATHPSAEAVHSAEQGWLIVADDSPLNLASGHGQAVRHDSAASAWIAASLLSTKQTVSDLVKI